MKVTATTTAVAMQTAAVMPIMPRNGIPVTLRASRATITVAPAKTTALPDVPLARPIDSCRSTPARSWRR